METEISHQIYSPTSFLALFNNALRLPGTENLIYLRGRYSFGGGKAYTNYFYDNLFAEGDSTSITVKVSRLLRTKITNNEVYTLCGYVEKSMRNSSININFVIDGIISQEESTFSEEDLKKFELIQKKLELGSKDLENVIRTKILNSQIIKVANIYGNNAIVHKDFKEGLDVSEKYFKVDNFNCNITSSTSIIDMLKVISKDDYDVVALVRGGGDQQSFEVFNDPVLAEAFINLNPVSVTAIGHTINESLLDKLADRRFHLPHDYGSGLHNFVNKLVEEKSNSRAILIDEVKKDIGKQFTEQVKTLQGQLAKKNDEFVEAQKTYKESVENQTKSFNDQLKVRSEELEKLKKEITDTYGKQVNTLNEQLAKKNQEFQKFQDSSVKQVDELNKNFAEQQRQRQIEIENSRKEIALLHEKNILSAVNEKTASLNAQILNYNKEIKALKNNKTLNLIYIITAVILGLIAGYFIFK